MWKLGQSIQAAQLHWEQRQQQIAGAGLCFVSAGFCDASAQRNPSLVHHCHGNGRASGYGRYRRSEWRETDRGWNAQDTVCGGQWKHRKEERLNHRLMKDLNGRT